MMSQFESPYYGNGGGYLATQTNNASPGGAMRRSGVSQSLRPVTIKQLNDAEQAHADGEWSIGDVEIGPVTVVAQVMKVTPQATNCVYDLDDGTGTMTARHWVDSSQSTDDETIKESTYIRVIGTLKAFGGKRFINATSIRPCTDSHEVEYHSLEVCTVTLIMTRGPPPRPGEEFKPTANNKAAGASAYTAQAAATPLDQYAHLEPLQRKIVNFIVSQPNHDEGVHVAAIARAVGGDAHAISSALDHLMDDGVVFTTNDEHHYKVSI